MANEQTQNPRRKVYAINGSGGAQVVIAPTGPCRYMTIVECPPNGGSYNGTNYTPQGINYQRADENYANTYGLVPGDVIQIGEAAYPRDKAIGIPTGMTDPAGNAISQSVLATLKLISATTTATQVEVDEWL